MREQNGDQWLYLSNSLCIPFAQIVSLPNIPAAPLNCIYPEARFGGCTFLSRGCVFFVLHTREFLFFPPLFFFFLCCLSFLFFSFFSLSFPVSFLFLFFFFSSFFFSFVLARKPLICCNECCVSTQHLAARPSVRAALARCL